MLMVGKTTIWPHKCERKTCLKSVFISTQPVFPEHHQREREHKIDKKTCSVDEIEFLVWRNLFLRFWIVKRYIYISRYIWSILLLHSTGAIECRRRRNNFLREFCAFLVIPFQVTCLVQLMDSRNALSAHIFSTFFGKCCHIFSILQRLLEYSKFQPSSPWEIKCYVAKAVHERCQFRPSKQTCLIKCVTQRKTHQLPRK